MLKASEISTKCPHCAGEGRILGTVQCMLCHGSKRVGLELGERYIAMRALKDKRATLEQILELFGGTVIKT